MKPGKRFPLGRCLAVLAAAIFLIGALTALYIHRTANEQWSRMEARIEALRRSDEARTYARPVLQGTATPGNAWDDYAAADTAAGTIKPSYNLLSHIRGDYRKDPLSKAVAAAAPFAAALDHLRTGVRRAESRPVLGYVAAFNPRVFGLDRLHQVPWAGMVEARVMLAEGRAAEAVNLWLDLFQFGRDLVDGTSQRSEYLGVYMLDYLTFEVRTALMEKKIPAEAARTLDRGLEILDRHWPARQRLLENHLLALGMALSEEAAQGNLMYQGWQPRPLRSWRWAYSSRLRAAATFHFCDSLVTRSLSSEEKSHKEVNAARDQTWSDLWDWPEPIVRDTVRPLLEGGPAGPITQVRLLRVAAHYLATGEVLELKDSFGTPIKTSIRGTVLRAAGLLDRSEDDGVSLDWWTQKPPVIRVER